MFQKELGQRITIIENGQRRTITKIEAVAKQLVNKAAAGEPKAIQSLMKIPDALGELKLPDVTQPPKPRRFTLHIFEKDLATGQYVPANPPCAEDS